MNPYAWWAVGFVCGVTVFLILFRLCLGFGRTSPGPPRDRPKCKPRPAWDWDRATHNDRPAPTCRRCNTSMPVDAMTEHEAACWGTDVRKDAEALSDPPDCAYKPSELPPTPPTHQQIVPHIPLLWQHDPEESKKSPLTASQIEQLKAELDRLNKGPRADDPT